MEGSNNYLIMSCSSRYERCCDELIQVAPKEALYHLFNHCTTITLGRLRRVNKRLNYEILRYLPKIPREPELPIKERAIEKIENVISIIEIIPVVRYAMSPLRFVGGVITAIWAGIGFGISHIVSDSRGESDSVRYCQREAIRGLWNVIRGLLACIPIGGLAVAILSRHNIMCEYIHERALDCTRIALGVIDHVEKERNINYLSNDRHLLGEYKNNWEEFYLLRPGGKSPVGDEALNERRSEFISCVANIKEMIDRNLVLLSLKMDKDRGL
jgi:hypothetical protein